jgi:hypothetical protein
MTHPAMTPALLPFLIVHITAGLVAILSGYATVTVAKGGRKHRLYGTIFVAAMAAMTSAALFMAIVLGERTNIAAAVLAAYLTVTGWATARRESGRPGLIERAGFLAVLGIGAAFLFWGLQAQASHHRPTFYYAFASVAGLCALLDLRAFRRATHGLKRIARHLWRMCFAFFFAAGSFFLGQQKIMPAWMHGSAVLYVLGLAPLGFLVFWMIRVHWTKWHKPVVPQQAV